MHRSTLLEVDPVRLVHVTREVWFEARNKQHRPVGWAHGLQRRNGWGAFGIFGRQCALPIGHLEASPSKPQPKIFFLLSHSRCCVTGHEASLFCSKLVGCHDDLQFDLATPTRRPALGTRPRQLSQRSLG